MAIGKEENRLEKGDEEEAGRRSKKGINSKGEGRRRNGLIYNFKPATGVLFLVDADSIASGPCNSTPMSWSPLRWWTPFPGKQYVER
jgi:hypothetical protein